MLVEAIWDHFPNLFLFLSTHSYIPEIDPKNYLTYYKRATIYLAMGKFKSALPDLSKAIELKPDFLAVSVPFSTNL